MPDAKIRPTLVFADSKGNVYDHPDLLMLSNKAGQLGLPKPDELIPLPPESELFLLPGRTALGLDPDSGQVEDTGETAVAAFISPGHTIGGHASFATGKDAPKLPLFAYCAVGFANDRFYVHAKKVDNDQRQVFSGIPADRIKKGAAGLIRKFPENRLIKHLSACALTYSCPAARNLALGRFEAPLPTSRVCNANCVGCISLQPKDSGFSATQNRIAFTPSPQEIAEIMHNHDATEKKPVHSFGQGCEGEPLTEIETISRAVERYRKAGGKGTVNINTNASLPEAVSQAARSGVNSIRVSMNSADPDLYKSYYRPKNYRFQDVLKSIETAKAEGLFVSLNFLFFPGISDTESEFSSLLDLVTRHRIDFIQLRNLNIDPDVYISILAQIPSSPQMGLVNFIRRMKKNAPWLKFGYFNPYLGTSRN